MYIKRVQLENIKSHDDATFEFSVGSTAITGENGAGKTTIIEAIAWTMFDVLDYKKEDFVKRGAKKGVARVTFESGLDEREYTVYRDSGNGYYVYDPMLKMRIAEKKEEVTRFLWQHLGVEPGTDLEALFKHAIGVPQGTFTAVFLAAGAERKRTFDTLLKVEEYRRGAEELLKTQRFVENQINAAREKIARTEGEIGQIDNVRAAHALATEESESYAKELETIQKTIAERTAGVNAMNESEAALSRARSDVERVRAEGVQAKILASRSESDLKTSKEAERKIETVRADAERHATVLGRIHELERERAERDRLRGELAKVETAAAAVRSEERIATNRLSDIHAAHKEIAELQPAAVEQVSLEREISEIRSHLANLTAVARSASAIEKRLDELRTTYTQNKDALNEAREKATAATLTGDLAARETVVVAELASLQSNLERDEKFQSEIKNGLCPILSEKCLNLKEGQTLAGFISSQFGDVRARIAELELERSNVSSRLAISREAEQFASRITLLEGRMHEIESEGKKLRAERDEAAKAATDALDVEGKLNDLESKISRLDNPKGRIVILERLTTGEIETRQKLSDIETNLERLESDRRILVEQLEFYKDLDEHWQTASDARVETLEAYRTFLTFKSAAESRPEREKIFNAVSRELAAIGSKLVAAESLYESAASGYDAERHQIEKLELAAAARLSAETGVRLENAVRRRDELGADLIRLSAIRDSLAGEISERERLEGIHEATVFIRDTLKEAAPLVARNYVYHVSVEANQMFREITDNAERSLKWAEDYGIGLEEGGYERPFQSLSGGEQMAAALSVRLALLKQLSDIRIAFFDEPTTNMDAERRENLAMQIGQIRHFDQLFVISHDDTFEEYMDYELRVGT